MEEVQARSRTKHANRGKDWSSPLHPSLTLIFQISRLDKDNKVKLDSKIIATTPVSKTVKPAASPNQSTPVLKNFVNKSRNDSGYESPREPVHVDGTPPLCRCGRRSRKRQVYKAGPNTGRIFWSCNLKGRNTTAGCDFFLWAAHSSN